MIFSLTHLSILFDRLKKKLLKKQTSVHILAGISLDAISASKILAALFFKENIQYNIVPIEGNSHLKSVIDSTVSTGKFCAFVLVDCGGLLDLRQWLGKPGEKSLCKFWLLDSHRPIYHGNLIESKHIFLVEDGTLDTKALPDTNDFLMVEEQPEESVKDDEDEDENQSVNEKNGKKRLNSAHVDEQSDMVPSAAGVGAAGNEQAEEEASSKSERQDEVEEKDKDCEEVKIASGMAAQAVEKEDGGKENEKEEDEEVIDLGRKRVRKRMEDREDRRRKVKEATGKIEKYYQGNYVGKSVAGVIYTLCQQLKLDSNSMLWYWILGLTDQFINYRIGLKSYEREVLSIQKEVFRLNMASLSGEDSGFRGASTIKKIGGISIEKDFNLIFLKQWNLYDSLFHSVNMIAKMKNWKEEGRQQLRRLIAKLGIPLEESQQKFSCVSPRFKESLKEKMSEVAHEFNLTDIFANSFTFCIDHRTMLHNFDLAHAINAVLSFESSFTDFVHKIERGPADPSMKSQFAKENFLCVFNQIFERNLTYIDRAIQEGISAQKKLVGLCFEILERKQIKTSRDFQYVIIDKSVYTNKLDLSSYSIEKLAQIVQNIYAEYRQYSDIEASKKHSPAVIAVLDKATSSYTVLGSVSQQINGASLFQKNTFGRKFRAAAEKTKARFSSDAFDPAIVQVHQSDFDNFLKALLC